MREPTPPLRRDAPLLELIGIEKSFRQRGGAKTLAVKGVDLQVGRGETVALVGESGSGKSTLGRIALSLVKADQGAIFFDGRCLSDMPADQLRRQRALMQPIFQDSLAAFNPRQSVAKMLEYALRQAGRSDWQAKAAALLADVGLASSKAFFSRYPHELSGGQRQRLALARALAMDPVLIIADEPLSGADVSIKGQLLNLLLDLREKRNIAYLMITHDIGVARAFAHRVAVMQQGEIVETGVAGDVLNHPRHAYTQRLIAAVPKIRNDAGNAAIEG